MQNCSNLNYTLIPTYSCGSVLIRTSQQNFDTPNPRLKPTVACGASLIREVSCVGRTLGAYGRLVR
jgi:hypothetical protein